MLQYQFTFVPLQLTLHPIEFYQNLDFSFNFYLPRHPQLSQIPDLGIGCNVDGILLVPPERVWQHNLRVGAHHKRALLGIG